jgi:dihydrofolate reductase
MPSSCGSVTTSSARWTGIVFGRLAYQGFVAYWDGLDPFDPNDPSDPNVTEGEVEVAAILRDMTRIGVSRTLKRVDGHAILIKDDIDGGISRVKEQPGGDLLLVCGPELLATLARSGRIDAYRIFVAPALLGDGMPLFRDNQHELRLELVDSKMFRSGFVTLDYLPVAGAQTSS